MSQCKWLAYNSNANCGPPWSCLNNYDLFVNKVVNKVIVGCHACYS